MNIDGLSMSALLKELHNKLIGGRIDKIFQIDKYTLLFWIRVQGETLKLVLSANPEQPRIHLTTNAIDNPVTPPAFCMLLRKHLEDGRIAAIVQDGLDRTIKIKIDIRKSFGELITKTLTAELMGKYSNIILTSEEDIIIDSIKRVYHTMSRQREILPGHPYLQPPQQEKINLFLLTGDQLLAKLLSQKDTVYKALLHSFAGLGPVSIAEILWRAGLPADFLITALDKADIQSLVNALHSITDTFYENQHPTVVINENKKLLGITAFSLEHLREHTVLHFPSMSDAIEYISILKPTQIPEKEALRKLLTTEITKLTRKHQSLLTELATAKNANQIKCHGDNLMANLYKIPKGASSFELDDIYSNETHPQKVVIALNPEISAIANAQNYYHKYNKQKRAQQLLADQLAECAQDLAYLDSIFVSLDTATAPSDIEDIKQELTGYGLLKASSKKKAPTKISTPIKLVGTTHTIYIGKNNHQNDLLTFKIAKPNDLWFHTKDIPGSHVILQTTADPSEEEIYEAAQLASYFSKAKTSSKVPVDYTKRRHVKKPAHAKPGFVIYEQQNTIYVTPDEDFVKHLIVKE